MAPMRVAVIGGGIAGCGAAWSLAAAGYDVHMFEAAERLGGNAKTHEWAGSGGAISGLSVLAWPPAYFRNYQALLRTLGVPTELAKVRFFIGVEQPGGGGLGVFAHGRPSELRERYSADLRRWERLVGFISRVNDVCSCRACRRGQAEGPSFYAVSPANPLNLIPLWWMAKLFGISRSFWLEVFTAVHSSSFLTTELDNLPAMIAPVLEDIFTLRDGGELATWSGTSRDVFARMTKGVTVNTGEPVLQVRRGADGRYSIGLRHDSKLYDKPGSVLSGFDRVVFGCDATHALAAMGDGAGWLARQLLSRVEYVEAQDTTFTTGKVHADQSFLPAKHSAEITEGYANYVEISAEEEASPRRSYRNTFIVSSWAPSLSDRSPKPCPDGMACLITYGETEGREPQGVQRLVDNSGSHPSFSTRNLLIAFALRWVQGRGGVYYCGSYTTPGNGHDLSLLSGLVAAGCIGAPYPFTAAQDRGAMEDFELLRGLMVGSVLGALLRWAALALAVYGAAAWLASAN